MERSGRSERGSITGFYTVLVEGDDMNEPISDATRGILDGHIVLNRKLAHRGHFPAIDIMESISRVQTEIVPREQVEASRTLKRLKAAYTEAEDLINIGAYAKGSNPVIDEAIQYQQAIRSFLIQPYSEVTNFEQTVERMRATFQVAQPQARPQAAKAGRR